MSAWSFGLSDLIALAGILISAMIAILLYLLSKKINLTQSLEHRSLIQKQLRRKIHGDENKKVELVNARRFKHDYFHDNDKHPIYGYAYLASELKGVYVDGIEFFDQIIHAYRNTRGDFSLTKKANYNKKTNLFVVGVIPYNWVVFVNPEGDDTTNRMQVFVKAGWFKFPYKKVVYYIAGKTDGGSVYTRVSINK